jgi:NADPH2:quinone reductase
MRAVRVTEHGGPDVLAVVDCPRPVPGGDEVLVRNTWIGVNFVDLQHRAGVPYRVRPPFVPGTEAAGVVEAVGPAGDEGLVGRPVVHFGHLAGVYADLTAVPRRFVVPLDSDVPLEIVAAVTMAGTTADVLVREATTVMGQIVVVHAPAGSTGGAVVQLAAASGARVIALASTQRKAAVARELGAHHAIALDNVQDPVAAVLDLTGGRGADIVYDGVGKDTFELSLALLATRGQLVMYGAASGPPPSFQPGRLSGLVRDQPSNGSLTLKSVSASHYLATAHDRARAVDAVLEDVREGRLTPRVADRYPLPEAAVAHRRMSERSVLGKILLST